MRLRTQGTTACVNISIWLWCEPDAGAGHTAGASEEPLRTTLTIDQYDMIMDVVQNGNMLACAPRHLLRPYAEDGRLRVLSQSALQPVWRASAAYRPVSALSPAFSALLEMIQSWFAQQT
ncbi:hypothetical protein J7400_03830 [Shimia sp. R9_2]|uniref:LysR substrate-binding domain-containing protein n=1 Tax=Shimia sp. R9_2 TaxID=2821112 RepID=UPI001ADBE17B|nr:hypothetical protein [Shimia sp. R9_2]